MDQLEWCRRLLRFWLEEPVGCYLHLDTDEVTEFRQLFSRSELSDFLSKLPQYVWSGFGNATIGAASATNRSDHLIFLSGNFVPANGGSPWRFIGRSPGVAGCFSKR